MSGGWADRRRGLSVLLAGFAESYVLGWRPELTREQAIAELRRRTTNPDILAQTAALYVGSALHRDRETLALLVEAGADPAAAQRYAEQGRAVQSIPRGEGWLR